MDLLLDEYGDFAVDEAGNEVLGSEMDVLIQDISHRLMTVKGSLPEDPDYGGNLPLFVHKEDTVHNRKDLINNCQLELAKETRILPQRTVVQIVSWKNDELTLYVGFVRKEDMLADSVEVTA